MIINTLIIIFWLLVIKEQKAKLQKYLKKDQGRWDDRDYYDEHFYDIMYDKITEGMKLTVDEMDNLVSAGLFDKEIVPHEEYLEVNDNNQKMRTIVKLHDKYFEIRWTQYTHKDSEFPNDPVEVRKKPKIIDDWIPVEK